MKKNKYRLIGFIRIGVILVLLGIASSCSKAGNSNDKIDQPSENSGLPFEEDGVSDRLVPVLDLLNKALPDEICTPKTPEQILSLESLLLDGLLDDWEDIPMAGELSPFWPNLGTSRIAWGPDNQLALGIEYSNLLDLKIGLKAWGASTGRLEPEEELYLTVDRQGKLHLENSDITGSLLAAGVRSETGVEILLSNYLLSLVQFFPLWQITVETELQGNFVQLSQTTFDSSYGGSRQIQKSECIGSSNKNLVRWFSHTPIPTDIQKSLEKVLITASHGFNLKPNSSITLVSGSFGKNVSEKLKTSGLISLSPTGEDDFSEVKLISDAVGQFFDWKLRQLPGGQHNSNHLQMLSSALESSFLKEILGMNRFLLGYNFPRSSIENTMENLGLLIGIKRSYSDILEAISTCLNSGDNLSEDCILSQMLEVNDSDGFYKQWQETGKTGGGLLSSRLLDADGDGIPSEIESQLGLDHNKLDTDGDGWTDLSEFLLGNDPVNPVNHPDGLVFDGSFGEWFDLVPGRILVDERNDLQGCTAGDIAFYSAVKKKGDLYLGAQLDKASGSLYQRWVVTIDQGTQATIGVGVNRIQTGFSYIEGPKVELPFRLGEGQLELRVPINEELDPSSINIQIAIYDGDDFCDDTPFFQPTRG